ncbi:hypothetical protein AU476_06035 [Cupriavidus sp. UYMSc13B]|nr:hypothetical protein AU476_06035 [Cupriavidus sp. UYMSc13B]
MARLQQGGAVVLAVGDGINDAPVLAQAQVSIAIGSGAPLAQAGADAVLTHGGVAEIATALAVSRQTRRVVRQNLGWASFTTWWPSRSQRRGWSRPGWPASACHCRRCW